MDEQQLSEYFEEVGITTRRSFLRRTAVTAAALVGLGGGALLRPAAAWADGTCSCVNYGVHNIYCDESIVCCANGMGSTVEEITGWDCHNSNFLCWWSTFTICMCCCP